MGVFFSLTMIIFAVLGVYFTYQWIIAMKVKDDIKINRSMKQMMKMSIGFVLCLVLGESAAFNSTLLEPIGYALIAVLVGLFSFQIGRYVERLKKIRHIEG